MEFCECNDRDAMDATTSPGFPAGVADPIVSFVNVLEGIQKIERALIGLEDSLSLVAPEGDMIHSAGIFDSLGTVTRQEYQRPKGKSKHSIPGSQILLLIGDKVTINGLKQADGSVLAKRVKK